MISIGVFGLSGRMGKAVLEVAADYNVKVIWGSYFSSKDLTCQYSSLYLQKFQAATGWDSAIEQIKMLPIEGFLDFSHKSSIVANLSLALRLKVPYVCGVTGLDESDFQKMIDAGQFIPVLYGSNFSIFVAFLTRFFQMLPRLESVKIQEWHHRHKKDKPSGTARLLQKALIDKVKNSEIPIESHRVGEIFGIHRVQLDLSEESLVVAHRAHNRRLFARGL